MYSYPAGAIINGVLTTERTVRPALPCTINGVSYPIDIFFKWTPAQLAAIGIKEFIEDTVPEHFIGGTPVDTSTATTIHRTYPNPILQAATWRASLKQTIQTKKNQKRDGGFLVDEILFDSDTNANVAYLNFNTIIQSDPTYTTQWKASEGIWVEMNATLFAKVVSAFEANNQGAFAWQAQMDYALDNAPDTFEALKAIEDQVRA